jgi:hypothetical protein
LIRAAPGGQKKIAISGIDPGGPWGQKKSFFKSYLDLSTLAETGPATVGPFGEWQPPFLYSCFLRDKVEGDLIRVILDKKKINFFTRF